jgi:hypothetical protein
MGVMLRKEDRCFPHVHPSPPVETRGYNMIDVLCALIQDFVENGKVLSQNVKNLPMLAGRY